MHAHQPRETDGTTTAVLRKAETMQISDKTLHGRPVISADGKVIGSISELSIDTSDWRVESVHIELDKNISDRVGGDRTLFHRGKIELPVSFVQSVSDTVVLTIAVEQLRDARGSAATDAALQSNA
jgi:sporulation protein YlmC with PRC-barrel domain